MTNQIVVLGSINLDSIYQVSRFSEPGETIAVLGKSTAPGGKGANQAVAASRSGARVSFVGAVGDDDDGRRMLSTLKENDVETGYITHDPNNGTGTAVITVDQSSGQNEIMVYGGANQAMTIGQLNGLDKVIEGADFIIAQLETPQDVTLAAFKMAKRFGVTTILNPAPAADLIAELLDYTDVIIPNETESALLTGIKITGEESMQQSAQFFAEHGVDNTIITLGEQGVFYRTPKHTGLVPAFKVKVVDTTAAGDTFIGALSSQLTTDLSNIEQALRYAQRASSLAVQKMGAMPSIPRTEEVEQALKVN